MRHQQIKTIKPHIMFDAVKEPIVIYKCCFNGCGKTSNSPRERCKHGDAEVEMRRVIDIGAMHGRDKKHSS